MGADLPGDRIEGIVGFDAQIFDNLVGRKEEVVKTTISSVT